MGTPFLVVLHRFLDNLQCLLRVTTVNSFVKQLAKLGRISVILFYGFLFIRRNRIRNGSILKPRGLLEELLTEFKDMLFHALNTLIQFLVLLFLLFFLFLEILVCVLLLSLKE